MLSGITRSPKRKVIRIYISKCIDSLNRSASTAHRAFASPGMTNCKRSLPSSVLIILTTDPFYISGNHSNYDESKQWTNINLKTFFAALALTNPDVKQSQIAEDLGIAPATLSRITNGTYGDGKMRMEWATALKPYLMSIDIRRLIGEIVFAVSSIFSCFFFCSSSSICFSLVSSIISRIADFTAALIKKKSSTITIIGPKIISAHPNTAALPFHWFCISIHSVFYIP